MFQRRVPLNISQNIRQFLWPKMGWWRVVKYYRVRIIRLSASAESIAVNLAGGSAMSFTPFFGIHIFIAMGFAWLIGARMNIIAATVGTFVGNPWTFPLLLYLQYHTGTWIMSWFSSPKTDKIFNPDMLIEQQNEGFWSVLAYFWENFADIFIPTAIGGILLAIVTYPFFYILYLYLVRGAQRARKMRMKKKQRKLFNKKARGK